jgi:hypothetical protein
MVHQSLGVCTYAKCTKEGAPRALRPWPIGAQPTRTTGNPSDPYERDWSQTSEDYPAWLCDEHWLVTRGKATRMTPAGDLELELDPQ